MAQSAAATQSMSYVHHEPHNLFSQALASAGLKATTPAAIGVTMVSSTRPPLAQQVSSPVRPNELLAPAWAPAPMPYVQGYEAKYTHGSDPAHGLQQSNGPGHPGLVANNFYARSLHTPFYLPLGEGAQFDYGAQGANAMALLGATASSSGSSDTSSLPAFDVKAYTFRKKSRLYVAVKHKNALRIEPIIYLKTCILDNQREIVRNWDYLRFSIHRFRENALPKKKLSLEEMRTARILDVNISLVSPNNKNRLIEDSCPACVMRMDGERKIMQVLARNFKLTPAGEPVIDIRKGHAIVCIKLNCYCDHHNEQEGFVVRMQTEPEIVRVGGSVKLRICCEARSKTGPVEPDVEEEDGLTDIDAPVSTGSRSPTAIERSIQSPSLSYKSESPDPRNRQRQPSIISSSAASPRSLDERVVSSLAVEPNQNGAPVPPPPAFRQIYPLTPSEGTCLGGTRVTIHGSNFDVMQSPMVYFGKVPAELVTISHHDVMECTTPPAEDLKPGIVKVKIVTLTSPLGDDNDSVDFMYMAPSDYDFYSLAATSLSYAMANEYPNENSLAYILNAHGTGLGAGLGQDLLHGGTDTLSGDTLDMGLAWAAKEDLALDFLRAIQTLSPGRVLPAFQSETGHTLLHFAAQYGMMRLAKELLAMGIDHTAVDRNRKTALQFAEVVGNTEMVRLFSSAKVPPRPMVPRLEANSTQSTMKETVTALIQKHETTLQQVLASERERKEGELHKLRDRAMEVLEFRDKQHVRRSAMSSDLDGEDVDRFSEMSPSKSSDEGEGSIGHMEAEETTFNSARKRKSGDESAVPGSFKKLVKESELTLSSTIDPTLKASLQKDIKLWAATRGVELFGDKFDPEMSSELQFWTCDSATLTSVKNLTESASREPVLPSDHSTLTVMALSSRGLHLYTEQNRNSSKKQEQWNHWCLLELEELGYAKEDSKRSLNVDICGLVNRGRGLSGEQLRIESEAAPEMLKAVEDARTRLRDFHRMRMQDNWMKSGLKLWKTLCGMDDREFALVDSVLDFSPDFDLVLKSPLEDQRGHSLAMVATALFLARDMDLCTRISFEGAKLAEDGWTRPEVISELQKTVKSKKHVTRWRFEGCNWTAKTFKGFIQGFEVDSSASTTGGYEYHQCRDISVARNNLSGDVLIGNLSGDAPIGNLLVNCSKTLKMLEGFDLTDCNIGIQDMEHLAHNLSDLLELRLRGNSSDERWWQWMDVVLERNPRILRCSLGAKVPLAESDRSLISLERLEQLQNLVELDLTESPITEKTLDVLEKCVRSTSHALRTVNLSHCDLAWSSLVPLFKAFCDVNDSTKSTLAISKNPLFDTEKSIQDWEASVTGANVRVPFGIQMEELVIPDTTLQRLLAPLERATCFNELDFRGLYVEKAKPIDGRDSLSYDEVRMQTRKQANIQSASTESCQSLGRILKSNSSLIMLDASGDSVECDISEVSSSNTGSGSHVTTTKPLGGFGKQLPLAFPALAGNATLRVLSIDNNNVGENAMLQFWPSMKRNHTVRVLSCNGNDAFTPNGLNEIEGIFYSVQDGSLREHNTFLSVFTPSKDEILSHIGVLANQVKRYNDAIRELESGSVKESDLKFLGSAPLKDAKRNYEAAEKRRIDYCETHARIIQAVRENNRRSKEEPRQQLQVQALVA